MITFPEPVRICFRHCSDYIPKLPGERRFSSVGIISLIVCGLMLNWLPVIAMIISRGSIRLNEGADLGGDFIVFWAAAKAGYVGNAVHLYDAEWLNNFLTVLRPYDGYYGYFWQYPPSYLLLVSPFGFGPYTINYFLFTGSTLTLFLLTLKRVFDLPSLGLIIIICLPVTFLGVISGQNSFLIASLMILAAHEPKSRPILAGIAAGLLTVKPHLGLLIPIAYAVAGCWRAFGVAAMTTLGLICASALIFGIDVWIAFFEGIAIASDRLATTDLTDGMGYPTDRMTSIYAVFKTHDWNMSLGAIAQGLSAVFAMAVVVHAWRDPQYKAFRGGILCCAALLVPPYVYHYDLAVLTYVGLLIIISAFKSEVLPYEEVFLIGIIIFGIMYIMLPLPIRPSLSLCIPLAFLTLLVRRVQYHNAQGLKQPFILKEVL